MACFCRLCPELSVTARTGVGLYIDRNTETFISFPESFFVVFWKWNVTVFEVLIIVYSTQIPNPVLPCRDVMLLLLMLYFILGELG